MKKICVILRGCPGSGKSYIAHRLSGYDGIEGQIFSTDNYWLRPDGVYDFNARRLGEAHAWNFNNFKEFVKYEGNGLELNPIVDNTNIVLKDFKPYIDTALAAGYQVYLVEPATPWATDLDELVKKNTHGVPRESIKRMLDKWETSESIASQFTPELKILKGLIAAEKEFGLI